MDDNFIDKITEWHLEHYHYGSLKKCNNCDMLQAYIFGVVSHQFSLNKNDLNYYKDYKLVGACSNETVFINTIQEMPTTIRLKNKWKELINKKMMRIIVKYGW